MSKLKINKNSIYKGSIIKLSKAFKVVLKTNNQ